MSTPRTPSRGQRQLRGSMHRRQRGVAMLVAILLVALGTMVAAAVAYESAMSARRGTATLSFDEAVLVGEGAEALAAYGLQQVLRNTKPSPGQNGQPTSSSPDVYPSQPWAQPVGPIEVVPGVTLEASLEDLQGRFNLNWLVDNSAQNGFGGNPAVQPLGNPQNPLLNPQLQQGLQSQSQNPQQAGANQTAAARAAFNHLLELAQLDPKWTDMIIDWIDSDQLPQPQGAEDSAYLGQNPPYLTGNQYLTSITELLALPGFGRENYEKLAPYITALPPDLPLNICSAPGLVLDAMTGSGNTEWSNQETLDKNRAANQACFPDKSSYAATLNDPNLKQWAQNKISTTSHYFRLSSLVTIGSAEFNLYSVLQVDDGTYFVHPIQRSFTRD